MAVESPHGLVAEIKAQIGRGGEVFSVQGTFQIAKGFVVPGMTWCGFVVIVEPVHGLEPGGSFVFFAE
ncbi:MAG TPA: hypothetical protein VJY15_11665 [Candidatus Acidoferrum sp.]|jgi:hypothetical protein|nr:hypothetical protein [Candidatus Acidoferrum sp.]